MIDRNWGVISFGIICLLFGLIGAVFGHLIIEGHVSKSAYDVLRDFQVFFAALIALIVGVIGYHGAMRGVESERLRRAEAASSKVDAALIEIYERGKALTRVLIPTLESVELSKSIHAWEGVAKFLAEQALDAGEDTLRRMWTTADQFLDAERNEVLRRLVGLEEGCWFVRLLVKTINDDGFRVWTQRKQQNRIDHLSALAYKLLCESDMRLDKVRKLAKRPVITRIFNEWPHKAE